MGSLVLFLLLASIRAHSLDECLRPIERPSIQAVANARQAGLRREAHPEKKLPVATYSCVDLTAISVPKEVLVYGCSADKAGCRPNADEGDVRKLGGLRKEMKLTWLAFAIATLAITGSVPCSRWSRVRLHCDLLCQM